jgi:hypothetical protein
MSNEDNSLKQVVKPIYEQIESWNYELEELPKSERFMLDGVTPRVMVSGILQKAETLNQNKRVYPMAILKREVDNYQKLIEEKRAFGECVDRETSICTVKYGWKSIADVKEGELIYTINLENNNIQIEPVLYKTDREHKGDVIHIYNKSGTIDMVLTEDHKMLIYDRKGNPFYIKASELEKMFLEKNPVINKWSIRGSGKWVSENSSEFSVPDSNLPSFNSLDWMAFLGIWLSEGSVQGSKGGKLGNKVVIHQKKEDEKSKIRSLLSRMKMPFRESNFKSGKVDFIIHDEGLHSFLYPLGNSSTKYIPYEFKQWDDNHLRVLLDWLLLGDGKNRKCPKGNLIEEYASVSKKLAQDVREIMFKLGKTSSLISYKPKDRLIEGRVIKSENSKKMNIAAGHRSKGAYLDMRSLSIERKSFNDRVYCVTTGNGNWLAQRNGKMFWTGNCDHPEASVIELKNVSHVIRKTWWEGNDLYGRVEVLNTPAGKVVREIINAGLTLGISSRGVGSTRNEGGVDVVQEDFMLICWDFVSEPSTPGAFMFKESKEPAISRTLAESAFRNWGVDIKDKVYYDGLVEDQHNLNLCKNANSIIEFYNKIKG